MVKWTDTQWTDKEDYILDILEEYNVPLETAEALADLLGEDELFDGFLVALEEAEGILDSDDWYNP